MGDLEDGSTHEQVLHALCLCLVFSAWCHTAHGTS